MFKCDELIYIQLQKTGTNTIASLLRQLFDGEMIGKHNAATEEQLKTNNYFISSIRNPWDWYLSLWTYGVQNGGAFMRRLTQRQIYQDRDTSVTDITKFARNDVSDAVKQWRSVYDDCDNVDSFRQWLKLIHAPQNSRYLGEGYGATRISQHCGFMTYRYLYLCCVNLEKILKVQPYFSFDDLVQFDNNNCYINYFVRQETLEDSLIEAIERVRQLTNEEKAVIYGTGKLNTSKKTLSTADYFDEESIALIQNRDRLIIDKFNYTPPV